MKRPLFKDSGLQGTVLYQYELKECHCSILIQGHWIVEHTHMLVSIINEVLSLGCTSMWIALGSFLFTVSCFIFQGLCHHSFVSY